MLKDRVLLFVQSFFSLRKIQYILVFLLGLGLVAFLVISKYQTDNRSKASTSALQEAENGNLAGPVQIGTDSTASGGKYIVFGQAIIPTNTPIQPTNTPVPPTPTTASQTVTTNTPRTRPVVGDLYESDSRGQAILSQYFSSITMPVYMSVSEPARGQFDFSGSDTILAFAQAHNIMIHGHPLVWHYLLPDWLTSGYANGSISNQDVKTIMINHIKAIVSHYKGKVYSWDVVNEPIRYDGTANTDNGNIWLKAMGIDYVKIALQAAREADPTVKLYVNGIYEPVNDGSNAAFTLLQQYKQQGIPLDGVGFESHYGYFYNAPAVSEFQNNLRRFAALGLETAISEFDVSLKLNPNVNQAQVYRDFATICKQESSCKRFTVWGISDKDTWYTQINGGKPDQPLPFDGNYNPKPAFQAMKDVFGL